jgi:hypothetical protein
VTGWWIRDLALTWLALIVAACIAWRWIVTTNRYEPDAFGGTAGLVNTETTTKRESA